MNYRSSPKPVGTLALRVCGVASHGSTKDGTFPGVDAQRRAWALAECGFVLAERARQMHYPRESEPCPECLGIGPFGYGYHAQCLWSSAQSNCLLFKKLAEFEHQ